MYCSKCGKNNIEEALFCVSCGTRYRVDTKCPMCNTDIKKDENFCPSCGYNVGEVKNQNNSIYTKIMIIMNLCVYSLLMILGSFNILWGDFSLVLFSRFEAGTCLLIFILFVVIMGFGIYCLITKSKKAEIVHDCLSLFTGLLITLIIYYLTFNFRLSVISIVLFLIVTAYIITAITLTIIKLCKKTYSLGV